MHRAASAVHLVSAIASRIDSARPNFRAHSSVAQSNAFTRRRVDYGCRRVRSHDNPENSTAYHSERNEIAEPAGPGARSKTPAPPGRIALVLGRYLGNPGSLPKPRLLIRSLHGPRLRRAKGATGATGVRVSEPAESTALICSPNADTPDPRARMSVSCAPLARAGALGEMMLQNDESPVISDRASSASISVHPRNRSVDRCYRVLRFSALVFPRFGSVFSSKDTFCPSAIHEGPLA